MRAALALMVLVACNGDTSGDDTDAGDTDQTAGDPVAGAAIYGDICADCHGADGTAGTVIDGVPAADHTVVIQTLTDAEITDTVQNGNGAMPAQDVGDDEMPDLLAYLRQEFGGPP